MKERVSESCSIENLCEILLYESIGRHQHAVGSASRVVRTSKQVLYRLLEHFIRKVMVFPRWPRIEDREINSLDCIV
jgi:hypothetical protein